MSTGPLTAILNFKSTRITSVDDRIYIVGLSCFCDSYVFFIAQLINVAVVKATGKGPTNNPTL